MLELFFTLKTFVRGFFMVFDGLWGYDIAGSTAAGEALQGRGAEAEGVRRHSRIGAGVLHGRG